MENKFCDKCGSTLENGKCPMCNKGGNQSNGTKSGSSFGWGVLGFFFPVVGLILFLVLRNKNKSASKGAGIGALIGAIICAVLTIICSAFSISLAGLFDDFYEDDDVNTPSAGINTQGGSQANTDQEYDIIISKINISKSLDAHKDSFTDLTQVEINKDYKYDNLEFSLYGGQLILKGTNGKIYATVNAVDKAYYFSEEDCASRLEKLIVYSSGKVYYINTKVDFDVEIKTVELKNSYTNFYMAPVYSLTCGAGYVALGKTSDGKYYDLDGESLFNKDSYSLYNEPDLYINADRTYKFYTKEGKALAVLTGISQKIVYVVDSDGYMYYAAYTKADDASTAEVLKEYNSKVSKIHVVGFDKLVITFEDGTTKELEYMEVIY